jgi:23S rRNA (cytosine1962-C5)-methyltransferase
MKIGVVLKKGKEKFLKQQHLWIFSGAILAYPDKFENGGLYPVFSFDKELLGHGYFNKSCSLSGRMVSFGSKDPEKSIFDNIKKAIEMRKGLIDNSTTTAYRLINGEGDNLPGLIVDRYDEFLVMQIGTLGMEKLKTQIISALKELFKPKGIYQKATTTTQKEDGLQNYEGLLFGELVDEVTVLENNLSFSVSYKKGQKTGFFLDQREMRSLVENFSFGRRVLNCFSYSGAFSVYALRGKALIADSLDISKEALVMAKKNFSLNKLSLDDNQFFKEDVFNFLRKKNLNYNFIILDPPAFAKKQKDLKAATRGYKEINRLALEALPPGSLLLTSSCSYHIDEKLFGQILFSAALEAKRDVKIISKHKLAIDHPINIYHPEGNYLKSLLLYVN